MTSSARWITSGNSSRGIVRQGVTKHRVMEGWKDVTSIDNDLTRDSYENLARAVHDSDTISYRHTVIAGRTVTRRGRSIHTIHRSILSRNAGTMRRVVTGEEV